MARVRVGWASWALMGYLVRRALRDKPELSLDVFPTHEALLAADAIAPYDVVVLRASDPLNAEHVREDLERRGRRAAIALCTGCNCRSGIKEAHGIAPASFDRLFWKWGAYTRVGAWLESLALDDAAAAAMAAALSVSDLPDAWLDLPERLRANDEVVQSECRAEQRAVVREWHGQFENWLRLFMRIMTAHRRAGTSRGALSLADLPDGLMDEAEAFLLHLSEVNARVARSILRAWTTVAIEATREALHATSIYELDEAWHSSIRDGRARMTTGASNRCGSSPWRAENGDDEPAPLSGRLVVAARPCQPSAQLLPAGGSAACQTTSTSHA